MTSGVPKLDAKKEIKNKLNFVERSPPPVRPGAPPGDASLVPALVPSMNVPLV